MTDIGADLCAKVQRTFFELLDKRGVNEKVAETYLDAHAYAIEVGKILAEAFKRHISADVLPDGRMYYNIARTILEKTLGTNHKLITAVTDDVQRALNLRLGVGIKPLTPDFNQSRLDGLVERLSGAENYDEVAWVLDEPVINFSQSIVDDAVRMNADFHYKAGLRPTITRTSVSGCCAWCDRLAGTYDYKDVKDTGNDVFRRHERCRCTVIYEGKNSRVNVHTKKRV